VPAASTLQSQLGRAALRSWGFGRCPAEVNEQTPQPPKDPQTGLGFWASKAFWKGIEIGVFSERARASEGRSLPQWPLRACIPGPPTPLPRHAGALVPNPPTDGYANTPETDLSSTAPSRRMWAREPSRDGKPSPFIRLEL